jgi:hypothetical protein
MTQEQRDSINLIKRQIIDAHEMFSHALDAQHAYLNVAEKCMDMILEDYIYGDIQEG